MKQTFRRVSLKRLIPGVFLGIMIPLAVVLVIYSSYIAKNLEKTAYQAAKSQLVMFEKRLESAMKATERMMSGLVSQNADFQNLSLEQLPNEVYGQSYEVQQKMRINLMANQDVFSMVLYSPVNNWYVSEQNSYYEITSQERIRAEKNLEKELRYMINNAEFDTSRWFYRHIGNRYYLIRGMDYRRVYCLAVIDLGRLNSIARQEYQMQGSLIFTDQSGDFYADFYTGAEVLSAERSEGDLPLRIPGIGEEYTISGTGQKLMTITEPIGNLTMAYVVPYEGIRRGMNVFHLLMFLCAILLVLAVPFVSVWLWSFVVRPIQHLTEAMESIRIGNLSTHAEDYRVEEFCQINDTFNDMIDEISELKIASYEKELEKQKTEYQLLQAQIRPHFYLNCLKNLYGMAESGQYHEIQKTILHLSGYLRYVFSASEEVIGLKNELEACKNYVDLFTINQNEAVVLGISYDVGLEEIRIPPISILTFVENSVKYGLVPGRKMEINISVAVIKIEEGDMLHILIRDNGPGFSEEIINRMNREELFIDDSGRTHVGIYNVLKRFRIRYGDGFAAAFQNKNGAVIELFYPYLKEEKRDESADCR